MREVHGKEMLLSLLESNVDLQVSYDDMVIRKKSGIRIEFNDEMTNSVVLLPQVEVSLQCLSTALSAEYQKDVRKHRFSSRSTSWQAEEPKLGNELQICSSESTPENECEPPPPEKDDCQLFYNKNLSANATISSIPVIMWRCVKRSFVSPVTDSSARVRPARHLFENWRRPDVCPHDCPRDMIYEPCGCAKTCDMMKAIHEFDAVNMKTDTFVKTVDMSDMCTAEERFRGLLLSAW
ncbi:unnamed protein product [Ceratitis capitata]|uniref:(Mediterranean fruit fly) hypothetical protein n=1 Tax=Ceratitis capitata TaxID=7213 RepID=A0A811V7C2_CERCA|nr:unnamed protein product [Ceratitis capitata]